MVILISCFQQFKHGEQLDRFCKIFARRVRRDQSDGLIPPSLSQQEQEKQCRIFFDEKDEKDKQIVESFVKHLEEQLSIKDVEWGWRRTTITEVDKSTWTLIQSISVDQFASLCTSPPNDSYPVREWISNPDDFKLVQYSASTIQVFGKQTVAEKIAREIVCKDRVVFSFV